MFELFQATHFALAILMAYALWKHLSFRPTFSRNYIIIAGCVFIGTTVARYFRLIFRNMLWRQPYAIAKVVQVTDASRIQICVPRPWKVRAGEYVYIWLPGASFWSAFQSHPFMISWWDNDSNGRSKNIYLLLKPASGLTQKLIRHGSSELKAWIDGPYGQVEEIGDYGSILMFATGIGMAAQVPYNKQLLRGYKEYRVRTKSILVVWQLDKESKYKVSP